MKNNTIFTYGEDHLSAGIAWDICTGKVRGILSEKTLKKVQKNKNIVDHIIENKETVYGINTGFGPLCTTQISKDETLKLQENLLKSHSVGVGKPLDKKLSKLMLILKIHVLAKAYSGISPQTLKRIHFHIEHNILPVVPCQGSVGASGDLAPLAHLFLPLIGLGEVFYKGKIASTKEIFKELRLQPLTLEPKEGLALINGTQFMTAFAVLILKKFYSCLEHADIASAMLLDALAGSIKPFHKKLHQLRAYAGSVYVAKRISDFLSKSKILLSHEYCGRVQDPYSLRSIPQVHGASRNAFLHLKQVVEVELNAITDNPVIISKDLIISGGNFHGQPIALPLDYAGLAAAELGNISDRRIFLSLDGKVTNIPKLLMKETGLNSGFMILQYTTAALVSENKSLCFPASADSIPTSLNQEDHVSMGAISARKTLKIIQNVEKILAIEFLCAAQALDFWTSIQSSPFIEECHTYIRQNIAHADSDKVFYEDIDKMLRIVKREKLINLANKYFKKNENDELFGIY